MRLLIASDSFKHALPAGEVCRTLARGLSTGFPSALCRELPLSDGGEGTAALLTRNAGGETIRQMVEDPLARPVEAAWGWNAAEKTAFIDLASASGLERLKAGEQQPLHTSTFGTGQLLRAALERGAEKILLGLGGSATHDLGLGMAAALGCRFFDEQDQEVRPNGLALRRIRRFDTRGIAPRWKRIQLMVLCDVDHLLLGPKGAAHTFAPQKGAGPADVDELERGSRQAAKLLEEYTGQPVSTLPGSGAAGGAAAGALALLGGRLHSGIQLVLDQVHIDEHLAWCQLVLSGEGQLDETSLQGKVVGGLLEAAKRHHRPMLVLGGRIDLSARQWSAAGIQAAWSISPGPEPLSEALSQTQSRLFDNAMALGRLMRLKTENLP